MKKRPSPPAPVRLTRVPIPKVRDPFINITLTSVGPDQTVEERFWASTWNSNAGPLGLLVTESGRARVYRFGRPHGGFYSMIQEDEDTLWLCGDLSRVLRLSLSSGKFKAFETGAPGALVFQGMAMDRETGRLFAAAYPPPSTVAFSFDFRRKRPVKVFRDICPDHYMRFSFPNGDGTWSFVMHCPGESFLRWDPRAETVDHLRYKGELDTENMSGGTTYSVLGDDQGRRYVPGRGWYEPPSRTFADQGPRPEREMTWFARRGTTAWGMVRKGADGHVGLWDMPTGKVRDLCEIPNVSLINVAASRAGKLVAVTVYGEFLRFDGKTGALEMSRRLPTDAVNHIDCLRRIDSRRLLGTPFITQRFWEVDVKTKKGTDCGRAAPGFGEVLKTWKIGNRVYMAAYTGGELVEYDPSRPPSFPENPRVVADPPGGMRPVAAADDGRCIYYACSAEYGHLGSVLTRYDTRTGTTLYRAHPLPDQQIGGLWYCRATRSLIASSAMRADCDSATPASDRCYFARIAPDTLEVIEKAPAPVGTGWTRIVGPARGGRVLCTCSGKYGGSDSARWFVIDAKAFAVPDVSRMQALPANASQFLWAGRAGLFVMGIEGRFEVWDMEAQRCLRVLCRQPSAYRCEVQEGALYLIKQREILICEEFLKAID